MLIINERIKELRTSQNLTQKQIAEHLQVQPVTFQRFEYGDRRPSIDTLVSLADYFDVSLDYLVGRSDDPNRH